MWNLKKGHNELCRTDPDSEKSYGFQRRQVEGWGDGLGVWDGNPITLDCDDHCTTICNTFVYITTFVINSLSNNKKRIISSYRLSKKKKKALGSYSHTTNSFAPNIYPL